jgi:hypothetical protein
VLAAAASISCADFIPGAAECAGVETPFAGGA